MKLPFFLFKGWCWNNETTRLEPASQQWVRTGTKARTGSSPSIDIDWFQLINVCVRLSFQRYTRKYYHERTETRKQFTRCCLCLISLLFHLKSSPFLFLSTNLFLCIEEKWKTLQEWRRRKQKQHQQPVSESKSYEKRLRTAEPDGLRCSRNLFSTTGGKHTHTHRERRERAQVLSTAAQQKRERREKGGAARASNR